MRSEEEVRALKEELEKLTGYISELADSIDDKDFSYACCVCDVLNWVLGEESTENFLSDAYLNIEKLREWARRLEKITGVSFEDYR